MTDPNQAISYPILIRFAKAGLMRFIGHLDWIALQQAMFLRAGFKIVVAEGPSHRLRMKMSPPTPVGVISLTELTYLLLAEAIYPDEAKRRLMEHCPDGVEVVMVKDAGRLARKNPLGAIEAAEYRIDLGEGATNQMKSDTLLALETIQGASPSEDMIEEVKGFWGRILLSDYKDGEFNLLVQQREGLTFHAAKCAAYLEKKLKLPHYPIFTKMDYYRMSPSMRKLFG